MDNNLKANCTELSKSYNFYYHAPENNDYSLESYNEILSFNSLEEFWVLDKFVRKDMIENGMFFIMTDPILPIWEDKNNINGGCISWKVDRKNSYKYWIDSVGYFPKKNSSIIKLWFSEEIDIENMDLPSSFVLANDKIIYKSHVQNIDKDKSKRAGTYTPYEHEFLNNSSSSSNPTPIFTSKSRQVKV